MKRSMTVKNNESHHGFPLNFLLCNRHSSINSKFTIYSALLSLISK